MVEAPDGSLKAVLEANAVRLEKINCLASISELLADQVLTSAVSTPKAELLN